MGCCSSKQVSSNHSTPSLPESKLKNADLVFLVLGPAGSGTASFADLAEGKSKNRSEETLDVLDHFDKSNIHVRRTALSISEKQVVFIIPQEFNGEDVKESHVIDGVRAWLTTDCRDHPYVDYILFLSDATSDLNVLLHLPFSYLNSVGKICGRRDTDPLYPRLSLVIKNATLENPHNGVPDTWTSFIQKGGRTYNFEGTTHLVRYCASMNRCIPF